MWKSIRSGWELVGYVVRFYDDSYEPSKRGTSVVDRDEAHVYPEPVAASIRRCWVISHFGFGADEVRILRRIRKIRPVAKVEAATGTRWRIGAGVDGFYVPTGVATTPLVDGFTFVSADRAALFDSRELATAWVDARDRTYGRSRCPFAIEVVPPEPPAYVPREMHGIVLDAGADRGSFHRYTDAESAKRGLVGISDATVVRYILAPVTP